MIKETIDLTVRTSGLKSETPGKLEVYIPEGNRTMNLRRAILICPGGGYGNCCTGHEGENIALRFMDEGFATFILNYNFKPSVYPQALCEAAEAMKIIRDNAEKWEIDPKHVFVMGFSAGGHLAAHLSVACNSQIVLDSLKCEKNYCRPDGMILAYPVITGGKYAHKGSFINLLGEDYTEENAEEFSIENLITDNTPPAFIVHTYEDDLVPVENSIMLFSALKKHNISAELHIFPHGYHGISLADGISVKKNEEACVWPQMASRWAKNL